MSNVGPVSSLQARTPKILAGDRLYIDGGGGAGDDWSVSLAVLIASLTAVGVVTVTQPATAATLTIANNKTLTSSNTLTFTGTDGITVAFGGGLTIASGKVATINNTLTFAGTDSTTMTFPGTSDTLAGLGTANIFTANQTVSSASLILSGNISAAAWTTSGLKIKQSAATLTDTSSSGTIATAYTNVLGAQTIAASAATTFTNYFGTYFNDPVAGSNVTLTNKWSIGADSAKFGTSNQLTISTTGVLTATSPVFTTPALGVATGTSLALNGASIGTDKFAVTGTSTFSGSVTTSGGNFIASIGSFQGVQVVLNVGNGTVLRDITDGTFRFAKNNGTNIVPLGALAANNLRLGVDPSASPTANTLTIGEASRGGTDTNVSGANGTIQSGLGTGNAAASKLIFQVPIVGSSGTTAETYGTAITINNSTSGGIQFNGYTSAGAVSTDASGNLSTASALALKTNIRTLAYGLETIAKINPKWWKWKAESGLETSLEYGGFIADEVEALVPELHAYGKGDPSRIVLAICVNAIKELAQRLQ